jgi:NAD(P)-dependent dehydrogenase (short-subunit alcohol dehydrogenase family)
MTTDKRPRLQINGCVAIVTGANRGIGEAFVRVLLESGAGKVYAGSREPGAAKHLAGERCEVLALDVTNEQQVFDAANACASVNLVVNNAGVFKNRLLIGAPDTSGAREEMEVNYFGTLSMCRAFAPVLARNGGGAIINVLSAAALVNVPNMGGYGPSKTAARFLSAGVRAELAPQGTQVTSLIVGSVDTRMAAHVQGAKEHPDDIARVGLKAATSGIDEVDTDRMAVELRASLALDPKAVERRLARLLQAEVIRTGR